MKCMPPDEAILNRHAHILKLPMELLIAIANWVKVSKNTEITVFKNRYSTLNRLSIVNRDLRRACLAAGLYDHVAPKCKIYKASVELSHPLFQTDARSLKSLGIDLGNTEAWPLYEVIMKEFPQLEELTFTGNAYLNRKVFRKSSLGKSIQQFKGMSLRLSNAYFNSTSYILFTTLPRENIRQLDFASSQFSESFSVYPPVTKPLFPNLKKIKYRCAYSGNVDTTRIFAEMIITGCTITHFEVQYGSGLYCCGEPDHKRCWEYENRKRLMETENPKYPMIKNALLKTLQSSSHNSLQIFIVNDLLDNTFMKRIENHYPMPGSFSTLKLVVFRWRNLNRLIETEFSWATKDCSAGFWYRVYQNHHHSAWLHLADEYSLFYKCDCLLLKSSQSVYRRPPKVPNSFWKTASSRLLSRVWIHERKRPLLRYFIVGNELDGYQGIERDLNIPFTIDPNTEEIKSWAYIVMTGIDCRRVLDARLKYL